jgi:putative MATE family efflux protein
MGLQAEQEMHRVRRFRRALLLWVCGRVADTEDKTEEQQDTAREETEQNSHDRAREIITSGHISTAVWFLTWPTVINLLIFTAYNIINRMFVGRLGDHAAPALAAVGIGGMITMIQFSVMWGLSAGTSALVSRFLGAKEYGDADEATRQSLILGLAASVVTMLPLLICPGPIMKLAGGRGEVVTFGRSYLFILGAFSAPMFLYTIVTAALRAAGDVRRPLYAGAMVIGLNIVCDWVLIFGKGPFPAMGVSGAAIGTGISRIAGTLIILAFLKRSVLRGALAHMRPHPKWFWRILNIGWPAIMQNLLWSTGTTAFIRVLSFLPDPTAAQAALTVSWSIEMLAFMPGIAYSMAAGPLVGQNLGAGKPERAQHSVWVATGQAAAVMGVVGAVLFIVPRHLGMVFTHDPAVVPLIVSYLRINSPAEPLLAVGMVMAGALQGAGDTRMPTWIEFVTNWVVRLPMAYVLAVTLGWGVMGAWVSLCATTVLYGFLTAGWFIRGNWKTIKV